LLDDLSLEHIEEQLNVINKTIQIRTIVATIPQPFPLLLAIKPSLDSLSKQKMRLYQSTSALLAIDTKTKVLCIEGQSMPASDPG